MRPQRLRVSSSGTLRLPLLDPVAVPDDSTKIHRHFCTSFTYWETYEAEKKLSYLICYQTLKFHTFEPDMGQNFEKF